MEEQGLSTSDSGVSDSEEEGTEVLNSEKSQLNQQQKIYKGEELHDKLEDIMWEGATFLDSQAVTASTKDTIDNVEDDLQRELCFYNQALSGASSAIERLEEVQRPWARPPDYYAEMVKSDSHMANIKEQLMREQQKIEKAEERRRQREAKRANKELQAQRAKEKAQAKKSNIVKVDQLRKQRQQSNFTGDFDVETELAALDSPYKAKGSAGQRILPGKKHMSRKREAKNAKFGFGGRKRVQKQNDSSSAANMNSFKSVGGKRKGGVGKKGQQRPGKARRAAGRGKR